MCKSSEVLDKPFGSLRVGLAGGKGSEIKRLMHWYRMYGIG